jgi:hypothetical protein
MSCCSLLPPKADLPANPDPHQYGSLYGETRSEVAGERIMRFLPWLIAAILAIVLVVIFRGRVPQFFVPDGHNLVKNGSFEGGNPVFTDDEPFIGGPNDKALCDGSTTMPSWVASGVGAPNPNRTCSGGRTPDAIAWIANSHECPPQVPPCPDTLGIAAEDGDRLVDLTGLGGRVPDRYGSVSQTVDTEVGQTYEVSFFIGSASDQSVAGDQHGAVFVEIAGVSIPNNPFPAPPPQKPSNWSDTNDPPRFRFIAVSRSTTLKFSGAVSQGKGTDYIGLDNVSLQKVCFIVFALTVGCPSRPRGVGN